jgi:inner membrane protein COX18
MIARRNELFAQHRCRPWLTMLIPPLTQLPVFVGSSMFLSRLSQPPTAFDSEAFLTLTSLAHPDPTVALPIALGVITLANVESSRWFISAAAREREEAEQKRVAEQRAQGRIVLEPRKIVQSGLRLLSVGRILISAVVPGVRALSLSLVFFSLVSDWPFTPMLTFHGVVYRAWYFTGSRRRLSVSCKPGHLTTGKDEGPTCVNLPPHRLSLFHRLAPPPL